MKWIPLTASLCLLFSTAMAQEQPLSVDQAVQYALKNNMAIKNAMVDIAIQKQINREVTANAYPQISASGNVQHFPSVATQVFPNFIALGTYGVLAQEGVRDGSGNSIQMPADVGNIEAQFGTKWNANAGVQLSQLLFDGQVFVGLQARDASMRLVNAQKAVTDEQIAVNVEKIYYQLVVGQRQLTSIEANVSRFEKLLADTREIYKNGFAEGLDVDKVTVQLNNLKTERLKVQNSLDMGEAGLKFLMNMPQQTDIVLTDTLSEEVIIANLMDSSYNPADRREYKALEIARELNRYNIKRHQYSALPRVALAGSYSVMAQRNQFNFFNSGKWYPASMIGLNVSVPIFDGFARRSRVEKARLEVDKLSNNLEQLRANIDNEVVQARLQINSARLQMENQRENLKLAEKVFNTTKLKYDQGLGSNQEIYNAQTELRVAQNNYYSALYDAITAQLDFMKATGKYQFP